MKLELRHLKALAYAQGVVDQVTEEGPLESWSEYKPDFEEAMQIIKDELISFRASDPDNEDLGNIHNA